MRSWGYLGRGGYGEVYRVRDHYLNATFALKLLHTFAGTNVWAEAQILMELKSPYILEVENADIDAGVPFLVTALAANGSANVPMTPIGVPPEEGSPVGAPRLPRSHAHTCRGTPASRYQATQSLPYSFT
jgi:serine/threonine protein kinase